MVKPKTYHKLFFWILAGIGFVCTLVSILATSAEPALRLSLLGIGLFGMAGGLFALQLGFFAEGDIRYAPDKSPPKPPADIAYPPELRNPVYRGIWKNITLSGQLMQTKGRDWQAKSRVREKEWLGLPAEEEILLVGESHPTWSWLLAILSIVSLAASGFISESSHPHRVFALLTIGLLGALLAIIGQRKKRIYLTNYRILVGKWRLFKRAPFWQDLHYRDILLWQKDYRFLNSAIKVHSKSQQLLIEGLPRKHLNTIDQILATKGV